VGRVGVSHQLNQNPPRPTTTRAAGGHHLGQALRMGMGMRIILKQRERHCPPGGHHQPRRSAIRRQPRPALAPPPAQPADLPHWPPGGPTSPPSRAAAPRAPGAAHTRPTGPHRASRGGTGGTPDATRGGRHQITRPKNGNARSALRVALRVREVCPKCAAGWVRVRWGGAGRGWRLLGLRVLIFSLPPLCFGRGDRGMGDGPFAREAVDPSSREIREPERRAVVMGAAVHPCREKRLNSEVKPLATTGSDPVGAISTP
jgi:hypothetical protein